MSLQKLTHKKNMALEYLATGHNIEETSIASNVSRVTIYKWLSNDLFKRTLKERQSETLSRLSLKLVSISEKALDILDTAMSKRELTSNELKSMSLKLKASNIALSRLSDIAFLSNMSERLSRLEEGLIINE
jgi:hypothetical protein